MVVMFLEIIGSLPKNLRWELRSANVWEPRASVWKESPRNETSGKKCPGSSGTPHSRIGSSRDNLSGIVPFGAGQCLGLLRRKKSNSECSRQFPAKWGRDRSSETLLAPKG